MAKAKGKKSTGKAKKKDSGSTLPKILQSAGLSELMNSALGRQILADALVAAAGAAAAALTRTKTAKEAGAAVADAGSQAAEASKDTVLNAADTVAGVVTQAARHFFPSTLGGDEDEAEQDGKSGGKKAKYAHRSSNHSKRKTSKAKDEEDKGH